MHKVLYKAFTPSNLASFLPVFINEAKGLAAHLDAAIATGATHEMLGAFNDLTLNVMVEMGFGDSITLDDRKIIYHAFRHLFNETQNPLHDIPILNMLPFPSVLEVKRQFRILHETAEKIVKARRSAIPEDPSTPITPSKEAAHEGKYVIDLLLEAHGSEEGSLSDVELRDNIIMLLVAGSETTGTTLTWILHHISRMDSIREKILKEIDSLDISWDGVNISNFDKEMPYLTKVIKETLRITPAVFGIPERIFIEDSTIGDINLPAGSRVGVAQYVMHHNPDYWPDATTFNPERFDPDAPATHPYAYLPFGLGRRMCMGRTFAMNEMRVVIALLLK